MSEAMKTLLSRIQAATGPDRRLDYEVFCVFAEPGRSNPWDPKVGHFYTSSVDDVLSLFGKHIAGVVDLTIGFEPDDEGAWPAATVTWYPRENTGPNWHAQIGSARTLPLALCVTVLQAALAASALNEEARRDG